MNFPDAYPLNWPESWKRTPPQRRKRSRYHTAPAQARSNLLGAVRLLGGDGVCLSSDLPVGRNGQTKVLEKPPEDPGVAITWVRNGRIEVMACDRWQNPWENMQALYHAIEGLRSMERSGATQVVEQAFQAFRLPVGNGGAKGWRDALGVERGLEVNLEYVRRLARVLMAKYHPDKADGDEERFKQVAQAVVEAQRELGG
jgi:hypothetical protein